jgi:hypothetical protein
VNDKTTNFACLPMYWFPETVEVHQSLWQAIAEELDTLGYTDIPERLTPPPEHYKDMWQPGLLLGQTCGYPLVTDLAAKHPYKSLFKLIATPVYDTPYTSGAWCRSVVLVHKSINSIEDVRGGRCVFNERNSQSGYNALRHFLLRQLGPGKHFSEVIESGAHKGSITALNDGRADICAVDCVSYSLLRDYYPQLFTQLRVLATTEAYPGLPLISTHRQATALRLAISNAMKRAYLMPVLNVLRWRAIEYLPIDVYDRVLAMEHDSMRNGYPDIV